MKQRNRNRPVSNKSELRRTILVLPDRALVPLTQDYYATVDLDAVPLIYRVNWHADVASSGHVYAVKRVGGKTRKRIHMHRLVMGAPDELVVDHIDGNTLDNRRKNLRVVTMAENNINRATNTNNKSGHKGVSWVASRQRWLANIRVNKKTKTLGWFKEIDDAIACRAKAEKELHGDFARGAHAQT